MQLPDIQYDREWQAESFLSVLDLEKDEHSWNRLLCYFLNPKVSPYGRQIITNFIEGLQSKGIEIRLDDLEKIRINREVEMPSTDAPEVQGAFNQADIVIKSDDWFIWIELKIGSSEGNKQTQSYVYDKYIGQDDPKSNYDHQVYVYISPPGNPPDADEFWHITWDEVTDWLNIDVDRRSIGKKQLDTFRHVIRSELGLNTTMVQDKTESYLKLWAEDEQTLRRIEDLQNNFEQFISCYRGEEEGGIEPWWDPFLRNLPDRWSDEWNVYKHNEYGWIYLDEWEICGELPFHLEHLAGAESQFKSGNLVMRLDCEKQRVLPVNVKSRIRSHVESDNRLKELCDSANIRMVVSRSKLFQKTYNFEVSQDLVSSRTATLRRAFDEFEPVAQRFNEIVKEEWSDQLG